VDWKAPDFEAAALAVTVTVYTTSKPWNLRHAKLQATAPACRLYGENGLHFPPAVPSSTLQLQGTTPSSLPSSNPCNSRSGNNHTRLHYLPSVLHHTNPELAMHLVLPATMVCISAMHVLLYPGCVEALGVALRHSNEVGKPHMGPKNIAGHA